ncbi:hypothetical protein GCM10018980_18440 [Streptomyces capoamus]|uniref:Uncharacterized protein n=1 Tax=Streptomyces capoamus TaxID=68183 RepID=A0A919C4X8_9ACTN|nr:hypothetical protein GCM10010501_32040 [Streptomyces libani subsp. rufus]GHG42566.1 hypothetical protein GCM10018980_18440 [Streptomyces capoamus]
MDRAAAAGTSTGLVSDDSTVVRAHPHAAKQWRGVATRYDRTTEPYKLQSPSQPCRDGHQLRWLPPRSADRGRPASGRCRSRASVSR